MAGSEPETEDFFVWDTDDVLEEWGVPAPTDYARPTVRVSVHKGTATEHGVFPLTISIDCLGGGSFELMLDQMLARVLGDALLTACDKVSELENLD